MVNKINNRIAAFEEMAATSKSTSKILRIEPTSPGFSAMTPMKSNVRGKETSGVLDSNWKPRRHNLSSEDEALEGEMQSAMSRTYEKFKMRRSYKATDGVDTESERKKNEHRDEDGGGYDTGPVKIVTVQSKERSRDGNDQDERDADYTEEGAISPLSFLEYHGDYRHENPVNIEPKFTPINEDTNAENEEFDLSPFHIKDRHGPKISSSAFQADPRISTSAFQTEPRDAAFLISQSIDSSFMQPKTKNQSIHRVKEENPDLDNPEPKASNSNSPEVDDTIDNVLMTYVRAPSKGGTDKLPTNENIDDNTAPQKEDLNNVNLEDMIDDVLSHSDQIERVEQVHIISKSHIPPNESNNHEQRMDQGHKENENISHVVHAEDDYIETSYNSNNENKKQVEEVSVDDIKNDIIELKAVVSSDSSDGSLVGAGIEDEDAEETPQFQKNPQFQDTPPFQDTPQFYEEDIGHEAGEEVYYGEAVTLPVNSMHEIYHSTIESDINDNINDEESQDDASAFEKGYHREIDAINKAQSAMEEQSHEDDIISPLPEGYDSHGGTGGRGIQFQTFPLLESPRNDDAESLGVSVLTDDTYGYEVQIKPKEAPEEFGLFSTNELRGEGFSSIDNDYEIRNQTQSHVLDQGTVLSSKTNKSTPIYRAASPLALNPNIKKSRNARSSLTMVSGGQSTNNSAGLTGLTKAGLNVSAIRKGPASSKGAAQDDIRRQSGLNTVDMTTIDNRESRSFRKKRSITSKLRRSLSPFRRNSDKGSVADQSENGSQVSRQFSLTSNDNTATIDNRKNSKKKSISSRFRNASPFRRRSSKNKIPHHTESYAYADESSVTSSRIGASPRRGRKGTSPSDIMREHMGVDDAPLLIEDSGSEI